MIALCTYFDAQYSTKGLALYNSLARHQRDFKLYILALDDQVIPLVRDLANVVLVTLDDIETPLLKRAKRTRDQVEYYWTITPFLSHYCLVRQNAIAYIDADMFAFSNLAPLYLEVADAQIAITPHRFDTEHKFRDCINGIYNVGWVYFKHGETAFQCLQEWGARCLASCSREWENGVFGDQLCWNELVPKYDVHVVQNNGADTAPWNVARYSYQTHGGDLFITDRETGRTDRLIFYHFHHLLHDSVGNITRRTKTNWKLPQPIVDFAYTRYEEELKRVIMFQIRNIKSLTRGGTT